jgi:hypothetical protein
MNALTIADLSLSQDLDRDALATLIGGSGYEEGAAYYSYISTGSWSGYYNGTTLGYSYKGCRYTQQIRWQRQRVQTEYSYWNWYY